MNIGVIFAGGVGSRMHSKDRPKQFLDIYNKPIIVHTIEHFQNSEDIDSIVVVCIEGWIDYMNQLVYQYRLNKVKKIVPGGKTGQLSIYNGLIAAQEIARDEENIVLIHDGVRPLINEELIKRNIQDVKDYGSSITSGIVKETIVDNGNEYTSRVEDVYGTPDAEGKTYVYRYHVSKSTGALTKEKMYELK